MAAECVFIVSVGWSHVQLDSCYTGRKHLHKQAGSRNYKLLKQCGRSTVNDFHSNIFDLILKPSSICFHIEVLPVNLYLSD